MHRPLLLACTAAPALALTAVPAAAQDAGKLDLGLEVRARQEALDGQFRPGIVPSDTVLLLRTDLSAAWHDGPVTLGGELVDSRAYLERTRSSVSTTEVNALEPIQAYAAVDLGHAADLQLGRFVLNLGSRRLVARNAFRNTINAFTGAHLTLGRSKAAHADLFWTMPQFRLPDARDDIQDNDVELDRERTGLQFFGAFGAVPVGRARVEGYVYRLYEADTRRLLTRDRHLWTIGSRALLAPAPAHADYEVEGAYQFGRSSDTAAATSPRRDVSAWTAHVAAGYTLATAWTPRLSLAFDGASGDRAGGDQTRFDPLFGARGFDFGPTSLYGALSRSNILGVTERVEVVPSKRWDGYLSLGRYRLDSATDSFASTGVRDPAGAAGHDAGTQVDLRARYWLRPQRLRLDAGFTTLFKDRFLDIAATAPRTGDTHYGYAEVVLTL